MTSSGSISNTCVGDTGRQMLYKALGTLCVCVFNQARLACLHLVSKFQKQVLQDMLSHLYFLQEYERHGRWRFFKFGIMFRFFSKCLHVPRFSCLQVQHLPAGSPPCSLYSYWHRVQHVLSRQCESVTAWSLHPNKTGRMLQPSHYLRVNCCHAVL